MGGTHCPVHMRCDRIPAAGSVTSPRGSPNGEDGRGDHPAVNGGAGHVERRPGPKQSGGGGSSAAAFWEKPSPPNLSGKRTSTKPMPN